jgi:ABC-type nitrate/sulfonate/bicarbonate transport system substrate-binding protein
MRHRTRRRLASLLVLALGLTATAALSGAAPAAPRAAAADTVRLALDWTPNTNHTGFFVAKAKGYYKQAGINFKILPYSNAATDTLVGNGRAECGINFEDFMSIARVAGTKETSVMAILQRNPLALMVLSNSRFKRPRDLDGTRYGATGLPGEKEIIQRIIKGDGGKGNIRFVTLSTAAYDAVYAKRVDFAAGFETWEVIEAKLRGIDLRIFPYSNYGVPDFYDVVLDCSDSWLQQNPAVAKRFLAATVKGWQFAAKNPDAAAKILIEQNPGAFTNPKLVYASAQLQVSKHYLTDSKGRVGCQTLAKWTAYPTFLFKAGVYKDADGKAVTTMPASAQFFTNKYLPYRC